MLSVSPRRVPSYRHRSNCIDEERDARPRRVVRIGVRLRDEFVGDRHRPHVRRVDERRLAVLVLQSGGGAGGDEHRDDLAVAERGGVHERGRALLEECVEPLAFRFRRRLIKRRIILSVQPGNLLHKPFRRLRQRVDGRAGIEQDPNSVGGAGARGDHERGTAAARHHVHVQTFVDEELAHL